MKKIVQTVEVEGEGLLSLLGEHVALWCECYIYAGILERVNDTCVLLKDAHIVYETGPLQAKKWADAQPLPGDWFVQIAKIESFGKVDR